MSENSTTVLTNNQLSANTHNRSVTTTIILILLSIIIIIIIYNYWVMYSCAASFQENTQSKHNDTNIEKFSTCPCSSSNNYPPDRSNYTLSDLDQDASLHSPDRTNRLSDKELSPTVAATLRYLARYEEGKMNPELKKYYDEYAKQVRDHNKFNNSVRSTENTDQLKLSVGKNPDTNTKIITTKTNNDSKINPSKEVDQRLPTVDQRLPTVKPKVKLAIYHMGGCGHCDDIMRTVQKDNKTKFQQLKEIFANHPEVIIVDYKHGVNKEADRFNSFPVIMISTKDGETEYNGPRDVSSIAKAVAKTALLE
jgi:hypothetical protein